MSGEELVDHVPPLSQSPKLPPNVHWSLIERIIDNYLRSIKLLDNNTLVGFCVSEITRPFIEIRR